MKKILYQGSYHIKTKKIKLSIGEQKHVPVRVMEVSLFDAYKQFVTEHPGIKVSRRNFEMQRPKHIRLKKVGKRLVCACTSRVNIEHLWKALNNLLSVNNKPMITDNTDLLNKALCNSDKISCIAGLCRECQEFKKLDELSIENLHCSKKCMIDQVDCTAKTHTIKENLFERVEYLHKGNKKKKIQLVEKNVIPKMFDLMLVIQITLLIKQSQACQIRKLSKFRTFQGTILAFFQRK